MPRAPRKCPHEGCETRIASGAYCTKHNQAWKTPSGWVKPEGWNTLRQAVLQRDNGICHLCGKPGADTVDHLLSKARGGSDDVTNLAAVHDRTPPHCHRTKTRRERSERYGEPQKWR